MSGAKEAWVTENPAVLAWKATKNSAIDAKDKLVAKATAADETVCENIYRCVLVA